MFLFAKMMPINMVLYIITVRYRGRKKSLEGRSLAMPVIVDMNNYAHDFGPILTK